MLLMSEASCFSFTFLISSNFSLAWIGEAGDAVPAFAVGVGIRSRPSAGLSPSAAPRSSPHPTWASCVACPFGGGSQQTPFHASRSPSSWLRHA